MTEPRDELPEHVARNRAYWDGMAHEWVDPGRRNWTQTEPHWGIWQIPESEVRLLPDVSGKDVIELGCGTAYVSAWIARLGGRPVGIDNSPKQLETARGFQQEFGLEFPLILGNAESVPLPDASFDVAISEYGAAIWADPYKWIPEAARLLRPGGELMFLGNGTLFNLTVPDTDAEGPASDRLIRDYFGMHRFEWPEEDSVEFHIGYGDWIRLLRRSGFEVLDMVELRPPADASTRVPVCDRRMGAALAVRGSVESTQTGVSVEVGALPHIKFPDGELESWFALGDVTDRSVRVWLREPSGAVDVSLWVQGAQVAGETATPDHTHDHIALVVLDAGDSRPDEPFEVRVAGATRSGTFAPAPGSRAAFTFAFGSCHQPFTDRLENGSVDRHPAAAIYPRIRELVDQRGAAFAMWLGDQVYSDAVAEASVREKLAEDPSVTDEALFETYRHLYRGFFNERGYRELAEALPAYLMWDDHDIFDGWGSLIDHTPFDERVYRAAEKAFREYQHLRNPNASLTAPGPFGFSFWRGDVGFHVPDLRSERDFNARRVMGDAGWAQLDAFLDEATERDVPTIFIGASVPVVHASPALMTALERLKTSSGRDVRDRWSVTNFANQRTQMVERLFAWQAGRPRRQVIVLSGDVHVGAAFNVRPRRGPGRFAQWTSSALSTPDGLQHVVANRVITRLVRVGERELRVWRRGLATSNNVGVVEVEPADGGGHLVRLGVHEYDAKTDRMKLSLEDVADPNSR